MTQIYFTKNQIVTEKGIIEVDDPNNCFFRYNWSYRNTPAYLGIFVRKDRKYRVSIKKQGKNIESDSSVVASSFDNYIREIFESDNKNIVQITEEEFFANLKKAIKDYFSYE